MANVPRFLYFLVWCGAVWGDRFIITPSEFFKEKGTFYSALVIYSWIELIIMENLPFAFVEKELPRKYSKFGTNSKYTLGLGELSWETLRVAWKLIETIIVTINCNNLLIAAVNCTIIAAIIFLQLIVQYLLIGFLKLVIAIINCSTIFANN